jgi:dipeptidyl aminopeptidase/acylaminoacyl peptidase
MERDLRQTPLYHEIEEHFQRAFGPAFGKITGATNLAPSPDGRRIAFTGSKRERLEGLPSTRIAMVDVASGALKEITSGPNDDLLPQWSPDGKWLAFLSDRANKGHTQLYLLEGGQPGEPRATPEVEGTVEYCAWSADGRTILFAVAGSGADLAGAQGSGTTAAAAATAEEVPSWMPQVESGVAENQWRRLWLYDRESGKSRPLSRPGLNVWEAVWAGPDRIAAIVSTAPGEDAWYTAPLAVIECKTGRERVIYRSARQLGLPAASPAGQRIAVVQAVCSDRGLIAGDLLLVDPAGGAATAIATNGVDVTYLAWRDEQRLFFAGLRGLETVYGEYNATTGAVVELWATHETSGMWHPSAAPTGERDFALALESYDRFPEIAIVCDGAPQTVVSLAHAGSEYLRQVGGTVREVAWTAPDGLEIQGLLAEPTGPGPHPLILFIHGGPVAAYRNRWSMGYMFTPLLVSRGYAVLHPNPRGSSGRGQAFAERVYGDMGGGETGDHLAGLDALVASGAADPARLGVMGGSHGGFMSSWIVTQTDRFAAAVPMSPVTDFLSQHYTSNIGYFDRLFLQDEPSNPAGRYFSRSPVQHAHKVKTPTLQTTGELDRCTPPTQAVEFHHALLEHGVESVLAIYPGEGHGVRRFPAVIDQCTRIVSWFERHMPANGAVPVGAATRRNARSRP